MPFHLAFVSVVCFCTIPLPLLPPLRRSPWVNLQASTSGSPADPSQSRDGWYITERQTWSTDVPHLHVEFLVTGPFRITRVHDLQISM